MSKQSPSAPTASAVGPCPTIIQTVGRTGTGSLPRTIARPDHPPAINEVDESLGIDGQTVVLRGTVLISVFIVADSVQTRQFQEHLEFSYWRKPNCLRHVCYTLLFYYIQSSPGVPHFQS